MSSSSWKVPARQQPAAADYAYDLEAALAAIVGIRSQVPLDAFTAESLGTERSGNGVLIERNGLVLTIGYLVTEAEEVWISLSDGRAVPGHVLGYDQETGFALVQALARVDLPALALGTSAEAEIGQQVVVAGTGGRAGSVAARVVARQPFAGYWEYFLDEAIFTAPSHPHWGGTGLIGAAGELLGIGSLQLQQARDGRPAGNLNMVVPIDLLKPILRDLKTIGRRAGPPRPWLGFYVAEVDDHLVVAGLSSRGPARRADLRVGDVMLAVDGAEVDELSDLFRAIWRLGPAGVEVPLTIQREGRTMMLRVRSSDRTSVMRRPRMH